MAKCNPKNHVLASREHCEHEPIKHRPGLAGTPTGCRIDKCTCCDCREWRRLQRRKERGADETAAPAPARPVRAAKTAGEPRRRASKPTATPTAAPTVPDPMKSARADLAKILKLSRANPDWWSPVTSDATGDCEALAALIAEHNARGGEPRLRFENDAEVGWFVARDEEPGPEPEHAPKPSQQSYLSALSQAFKLPSIGPGYPAGAVPQIPARTKPQSTIPAQPRPHKPVRYDGPAKPRNVPMGNAPSLPGSGVSRTSDTRLVRYEITPNSHWMCELKLSSDTAHCSRAVGAEHEWQYRVDGHPVCQDHYNAVRASHPKRCEYRRNHLWVRAG